MRVMISQHEISGKNHICSVKTQTPPEHSLPVREKIHWNKHQFGKRWKSCVAYWPAFTLQIALSAAQNAVARNLRKTPAHWNFNSLTAKSNYYLTCQKWAEESRKRNDDSLSIPSIFPFPSSPTFRVPLTFLSFTLFRVFLTIGEPGTGYSQPVCGVWQVHAHFFWKCSLCIPELQNYMRQL